MRISDWSSDVCSSDLETYSARRAGRSSAVASCAEAWIETRRFCHIGFPVRVASCAEAWIETETEVYELSAVTVASCAEAWIETIGYPLPIKIGRASCRERVCQYV